MLQREISVSRGKSWTRGRIKRLLILPSNIHLMQESPFHWFSFLFLLLNIVVISTSSHSPTVQSTPYFQYDQPSFKPDTLELWLMVEGTSFAFLSDASVLEEMEAKKSQLYPSQHCVCCFCCHNLWSGLEIGVLHLDYKLRNKNAYDFMS